MWGSQSKKPRLSKSEIACSARGDGGTDGPGWGNRAAAAAAADVGVDPKGAGEVSEHQDPLSTTDGGLRASVHDAIRIVCYSQCVPCSFVSGDLNDHIVACID